MGKNKSCFVTTLDLQLADKLKAGLISQGFEISQPQYTLFSGKKKGISCTLYQSGKLMVQGKEMADFIQFYLEPEILKNFSFGYEEQKLDLKPRIGTDEAGKGDYFGPLCIAGVHAEKEAIKKLFKEGLCDSKRISDTKIPKLAKLVRQLCAHHVIVIFPQKYNELYSKFKNLNSLLAWGHASVIEEIFKKTGCNDVIIDQFANEYVMERAVAQKNLDLNLTQRHRAEEDVVVAAASVLAREAYLNGLKKLSEELEIQLPKGATHNIVSTGKKILAKHSQKGLEKAGKLHFKTTVDIHI